MRKLYLTLIAILLAIPLAAYGQLCETGWPIIDVGAPPPSTTILPTGTTTWSAGNVYHIQGFIFVPDGATLVIEPGTIIKGDPRQSTNATALIISRGGKILAQGTPTSPIIFTSISDMVCDTGDVPDVATSRGLWGGVIILGKSYICASGGETIIEGMPDLGALVRYGGLLQPDCSDSSGVLQYVSIRYPGSIIGANNEINGLTLGGVGSKTVIDHIEIYYGLDDDVEFFGGSVDVSYVATFYGDDDGIDTDECYSGTRQFFFQLKDPRWGDRLSETDGRQSAVLTDTTSAGVAPAAVPSGWGCAYPSYSLSANFTCIGQGPNFSGSNGNRQFFTDNYRGYWYNNVFMEQPKTALEIQVVGGDAGIDAQPSSTRNLPSGAASIAAGHPLLDFVGNFWYKSYNGTNPPTGTSISHFFATGDAANPISTARVRDDIFPGGDTTLTGKNHCGIDPKLTSYEVVNPPVRHGVINPVPATGSPLATSAAAVPGYAVSSYYQPVSYVGGFDPNVALEDSWIWGWTFGSVANILGSPSCCTLAGDANNNGTVNILDATYIIAYRFKGGPAPGCLQEADANGNGTINILDATYVISYLFKSGPAPVCGP